MSKRTSESMQKAAVAYAVGQSRESQETTLASCVSPGMAPLAMKSCQSPGFPVCGMGSLLPASHARCGVALSGIREPPPSRERAQRLQGSGPPTGGAASLFCSERAHGGPQGAPAPPGQAGARARSVHTVGVSSALAAAVARGGARVRARAPGLPGGVCPPVAAFVLRPGRMV